MTYVEDPLLGVVTPFRYSFQSTEFGSDTQIIARLRGYPDKLIRVADGVYEGTFQENGEKLLASFNQYQENKRILHKLRDQYHISSPSFNIVVGPGKEEQATYYTIVDKIYGTNLEYGELSPREIRHIREVADDFFTSIVQYYWDCYKEGGWYLSDLTKDYSQFVYGRKRGEKESKIYYVDVEPRMEYLDLEDLQTHGHLFLYAFNWVYWLAKDMEFRTSSEFKAFRGKLAEFASTVSSSHPHYDYVLGLRK